MVTKKKMNPKVLKLQTEWRKLERERQSLLAKANKISIKQNYNLEKQRQLPLYC